MISGSLLCDCNEGGSLTGDVNDDVAVAIDATFTGDVNTLALRSEASVEMTGNGRMPSEGIGIGVFGFERSN